MTALIVIMIKTVNFIPLVVASRISAGTANSALLLPCWVPRVFRCLLADQLIMISSWNHVLFPILRIRPALASSMLSAVDIDAVVLLIA